MRIHNTSPYPDEEVRRLVEFGCTGINMTGVLVNVKGSSHAYAGRAYNGKPCYGPSGAMRSVNYLVVVRIGQKGFPCNNLRTTYGPWVPYVDGVTCSGERKTEYDEPTITNEFGLALPAPGRVSGPINERYYIRSVRQGVPYGGRYAPLIEFNNWKEAMVGVAAHEARHIYQFKHGKRNSERDCEEFAAKRLEAFREQGI